MVAFGKGGKAPGQQSSPSTYREPARNGVVERIEELESQLAWRVQSRQGFGKYKQIMEHEISALSGELSRLRKTPEYRSFIAAKERAITDAVAADARLAAEEERRRNTLTLPKNMTFKAAGGQASSRLTTGIKTGAFKPK